MLHINRLYGEPEIFESIQGEGRNTGKEVLFVRLKGCTLQCSFCDSKDSWDKNSPLNEGSVKMTVEELSERILKSKMSRVVITGGEPLLYQKELVQLPKEKVYEIETSGTVMPTQDMMQMVNQWNVSPKLSNSGNETAKRFKPDILGVFAKMENADFKFVIGQKSDIIEVVDIVSLIGANADRVLLMPLGQTVEELSKSEKIVDELLALYPFGKSDRLHIKLFGSKRGV